MIRESTYISIHALLAESDRGWCFISAFPQTFLSTLSLRRATLPLARPGPCLCDFYPRSPCGERRKINGCVSLYSTFLSTLSLRRATSSCTSRERATLFLSTLSLRRATVGLPGLHAVHADISIHALLAESDQTHRRLLASPFDFYPRSPCGERRPRSRAVSMMVLFLSTLSLRRATRMPLTDKQRKWHFYPRSPCGERRDGTHY